MGQSWEAWRSTTTEMDEAPTVNTERVGHAAAQVAVQEAFTHWDPEACGANQMPTATSRLRHLTGETAQTYTETALRHAGRAARSKMAARHSY